MPKIALVGAGSVVFAKNMLGDILSFPELADSQVALMDIDPERLRVAEIMARRVGEAVGARPTVSAHAERRAALDGADYVVNMIQVGTFPATQVDFDIPKKYGLKQTIADTLGIGGIFRALRTIPVMLEMGREMEEVCPRALLINYTNPMAMLTWAMLRATRIRTVGLCHSVQGTAGQLAHYIGALLEEIRYLVAGVNHMGFFLEFERNGEDAYPALRRAMQDPEIWRKDAVRFEAFKRLGYFVTESSEHFSEYVPWFIRRDRPDLIERFHIPIDEYIRRSIGQNEKWEQTRDDLTGDRPIEVRRSSEYGSLIVHSMETGTPRVVYGSVLNRGIVDNLPDGCCVEVPCLVDRNGVQPVRVGPMPVQLVALLRTQINVQELTVEAALTARREHVYHAAMLDPHTAAELPLDEIHALVDDLFAAHGDLIPPMS